jgi:hypothetical protein
MKRFFNFFLLIVSILALSIQACKKNTNGTVSAVPLSPTNLTGQITSQGTAGLSWTDNSTNESGFKIERKSGGASYQVIGTTNADVTTFIDATLQPNNTYTYRVYSLNSVGPSITYSNEVTLSATTLPTITTTSVSGITTMAATSGGNITADGGSPITARGVCWSTNPNPTVILTTKTVNGTGTGSFSSSLGILNASTTYYVRAYATNSSGTTYGNEITFTTQSIDLTTGLKAYYPFSGNTGDSSGNNYHGTAINLSPAPDRFGVANKSFLFGPNSAAVTTSLSNNFSNLTISLWFKSSNNITFPLTSSSTNQFCLLAFSNVNQVNKADHVGAFDPNGGGVTSWGLHGYTWMTNSSFGWNLTPTSLTSLNTEWHHVVYTRSATQATIYIDGVINNSKILTSGIPGISDYTVIGRVYSTNNGFNFIGNIDDVRIYSRVLTASEVDYLSKH